MSNSSLLLVLTCLPIAALAQHQSTLPPRSDLITLDMQPGSRVDISTSPGTRQYKGNVRLRQQGILLFCDRAVHQLATNSVSAAGHVLLVHNDSLTVKGDSLYYDGATRQATLTGHVLLQNGRSVLTTTQLDYDLRTGSAQYRGKGRFANGRTIQTVADGFYDIRTKQLMANKTAGERPGSNVPERLATVDPATPLAEDPRPVRLTMSPQPNNIATKFESVGTYNRQVRVSQRPVQTAAGVGEQVPDESDLEHLLNRRKRAF